MIYNHAQLAIAGESNVGLNRNHNEDCFLICTPPQGSAVLAVVADGIGGHAQGEVASYICCREIFQAAQDVPSGQWDAAFLNAAIQRANRRIFDRNFSERRERPMGCTVAAAVFHRDQVIIANAGDSRIYEYVPGTLTPLRQLSIDHRPLGHEGRHSRKHRREQSIITRAMGTQMELALELKTLPRPAKARYLICSDGLYSGVPDTVFAGMLGSDMNVRTITGKLMREALLSGVQDNISIICAGPQELEQ